MGRHKYFYMKYGHQRQNELYTVDDFINGDFYTEKG